ncbi:hypothetical protein ACVWZM_002680 [Bradyrhizobium sp. USDA 4501]
METIRNLAQPIAARADAAVEPREHHAIAIRDQMLIEAAARHCAGLSSRAAARVLHQALIRYACGPWRRERTSQAMPAQRVGRLDGACWQILRCRDRVVGERQLRRVLDLARKPTS